MEMFFYLKKMWWGVKKNTAKYSGTTRCNEERPDEGLRYVQPTDPTTLPRWEFYQCKLGKKKYFLKIKEESH
jgi:hypothetical protein